MPRKKCKFNGLRSRHTFEGPTDDDVDDDETNVDKKVDVVLVGNHHVGKTSFLFKFVTNMYSEAYQPSHGIDFRKVDVETHDGKVVRMKLWDTPGGGNSEDILKKVFCFADAFIIMYDVTDVKSYNDIFHWMEEIKKYSLDNAHLIFIGNKTDLKMDKCLFKKDGMRLAASYGGRFMETSVAHKKNIQNTFRRIATNLLHTKKY